MKLPRRRFLRLTGGAIALPAVLRVAQAQTYPSRPITIVVPVSPGGSIDVIARNLAERMRVILGQPVIIENVTGAGGTIGAGRVVRARPDGYTIYVGNTATVFLFYGAMYSLPYDVLNELGLTSIVSSPQKCTRTGFPRSIRGHHSVLRDWLRGRPSNDRGLARIMH